MPRYNELGRTCPNCGDCYRAVRHIDTGDVVQTRRGCGCVVRVVDPAAEVATCDAPTPANFEADTDTDAAGAGADTGIDTEGTVFTTLDQWIDDGSVATDGGGRR